MDIFSKNVAKSLFLGFAALFILFREIGLKPYEGFVFSFSQGKGHTEDHARKKNRIVLHYVITAFLL